MARPTHAEQLAAIKRPDELTRLHGEVAKLKLERDGLRSALLDCMNYVDEDNLTMQTKHRNWRAVVAGGKWTSANCEVDE